MRENLRSKSTIEVRVRYAETDRMGVVHHSCYLIWFEAGRTDYMRERGASYRGLEERGVYLPVSETYCRLVSPAQYDDLVTIETWIDSVKSRQVVFGYRALRDGKVLATGKTVHICIDESSKPVIIPEWVKKDLLPRTEGDEKEDE
ncbi:MAG: acyl-CoA thioesterase [Candidatus Glassbacteria bacterium]